VEGAGAAAAGVAAFQGTCWLLAHGGASVLGVNPDGSCDNGLHQIWSWLTGSGDDRSVSQNVITPQFVTVGGAVGFTGTITVPTPPSGYNYNNGVDYRLTCHNRVTGATQFYWVSSAYYASSPSQRTLGTVGAPFRCTTAGSSFHAYNGGAVQSPGAAWQTATPASLTTDWDVTEAAGFSPAYGSSTFFDYRPDGAKPWTLTWTETCRNGSGTMTSSVTQDMTAAETGASNSTLTAPDLPDCWTILPGSHLDQMHITGGRQGVNPPEVDITRKTFNDLATSKYPLCTTKADANGCWLDLRRAGKSCFEGADCVGWTSYEDEMGCWWGPYKVAMSWCEAEYSEAFDTGYSGQPKPTATSEPTGSASVTPGTGFPVDGTNPDPAAPGTEVDGNGCMDGFWSWNPVDWVLTPVKCALVWAFVPDAAAQTEASTKINNDEAKTGIGNIGAGLTGIYGAAVDTEGGGCAGPEVTFPMTHTAMHPFDACTEPMRTVAAISWAFSTVAICAFGLMAVMRAAGSAFGINFTMGNRGGES
ncbi:MAG TPA: hypothetical protein VE441_01295, partial [Mycobacterium sp.]|nr:hypothetical protein [Mycobacterium sp.]